MLLSSHGVPEDPNQLAHTPDPELFELLRVIALGHEVVGVDLAQPERFTNQLHQRIRLVKAEVSVLEPLRNVPLNTLPHLLRHLQVQITSPSGEPDQMDQLVRVHLWTLTKFRFEQRNDLFPKFCLAHLLTVVKLHDQQERLQSQAFDQLGIRLAQELFHSGQVAFLRFGLQYKSELQGHRDSIQRQGMHVFE